ncbi:methyltransferase family protein [Frigoriflavimonas asaccharolytica]|uniref:Protein-S-isoprenylcysteine O-methyltransferase Ste14 n=1 Tax=Frigoriflavimonas asaccharolytica TaxID=2735899 RepID=A0A8J8G6S3_9FLAO|nr:isoprenylcysteine carboxylmethyltransferase family protein [Frigoriflavimonas asaccharolytica]NRS91730.1 protein-S-isoprenylcysteine O-methyltransferase Ste14 [Frigoriflavimonas asaccharolytica]
MPSLFIWICGIWFISEIALNRLMQSKNSGTEKKDKNSLLYIWIAIFAGIFTAIVISANTSTLIWKDAMVINVGLLLIVFGIVLRAIIIYTLGAFFTVDVNISEKHELKTDGFYSFVRHPSYSASLISFIGLSLALNNWLSLVCILLFVGGSFLYRISVEEKALEGFFGEHI